MATDTPTSPVIEIFSAGTHTAQSGEALTFADGDLSATAAAYSPAAHEAPLCVGHPKHDAPAYGWVSGLAVRGGKLTATVSQVDPAFAELVRAGRYKHVSASFFRPDAADNPRPGTWYLRHVGFLGANPPAVKGLKPVAFAGDDAGTVTFGERDGWALWGGLRAVADLFRGLREHLIATAGPEAADKVAPGWQIDQLVDAAAQMEPTPDPEPAPPGAPSFAAPPPAPPAPKKEPAPVTTPPDPAAALVAREAALRQREAAVRTAEISTFLDGVADRIGGGDARARVADFMAHLDDTGTVNFADGGATLMDRFKAIVSGLPKVVELGEVAGGPGVDGPAGGTSFAAPTGYTADPTRAALHVKALDYQRQHPGTDYNAALAAVGAR